MNELNTEAQVISVAGVRRLAVALLALVASGCETVSDGPPPPPPPAPTVARIDLVPLEPILTVGDSLVMLATPRDSAGVATVGPSVVWRSVNPSVVTVSATGVVRGISPGQADVSASVGSIVATTRVTTNQIPVASITVTPPSVAMLVGEQLVLVPTVRDAAGADLTGRTVEWATSDPSIVAVTAAGQLTAVSPGAAMVTATSEGRAAQVEVTVRPIPVAAVAVIPSTATVQVGASLSLIATVTDALGRPVVGRLVVWSSSNPAVATVSAGGQVSGLAADDVVITAAVDGISGRATVTVLPVPVAAVAVAPKVVELRIGQARALTATATDAGGNILSGRPVAWTTSNAAIATVSGSGVVTAIAIGAATITATVEGQTGTATITVSSVAVASVAVTPATVALQVGQTQVLVATPKDAAGSPLTGRTVTWTTSSATVATVSVSGLVTAVAAGSATITATVEGQAGTAAMTVSPVPVASVTVAPATAAIQVGQTQVLVATPKDAGGNPLTGRTVNWTTSSAAVATVSAAGLVTGVAAGSSTITATSEGQSGTATVTVTLVPVATVAVSPAGASLSIGQTQSLSAIARDVSGNVLTGRPVVWMTSNGAVATVSVAGLVTAVAVGSATITATVESQSGTSAISVAVVPVASVATNPGTATLTAGQTQTIVAVTRDAAGNVLTGRTVTWGTSSAGVATVTAGGIVAAVASGTATISATSEGQSGTVSIAVLARTQAAFPLRTEAGKRYLVDAAGNPFLVHGEAGWDLIKQLTREEVDLYLEDRRLKGFNTVLVEMMDRFFGTNPPANAYGDLPFTTPGDFATPNEAYFAHAEYVISKAAENGIVLLITPAYMGFGGGAEGWYQDMVANGATKLRAYGQYLANRFRAHDNIIWVAGGDYNPPDLAILRAAQLGIRDIETKWLHTFHGVRRTSALGFLGSGESWLSLNNIYTTEIVVPSAVAEYARSTMPFFLIEDRYENSPDGPELVIRRQGYHAVLSGAAGRLVGNELLWSFPAAWQSVLSSPGTVAMKHLRALLEDGPWWTLQPDRPAGLMTAGGGPDADPNIAVAALATDRSFAVAYTPLIKDLSFDLTKLAGPRVQARWYDPTSGAFTIANGSPFTASGTVTLRPPTTNSRGFGDWALRLESIP